MEAPEGRRMTYRHGPAQWDFWARDRLARAMRDAENQLRDMNCPEPDRYIEDAMLALIGQAGGRRD